MKDKFPIGTLIWAESLGLGIIKDVDKSLDNKYLVYYFDVDDIWNVSESTIKAMVKNYKDLVR